MHTISSVDFQIEIVFKATPGVKNPNTCLNFGRFHNIPNDFRESTSDKRN